MPNPALEKDKDIRFPHFIVLKASAGSGKTHTLTKRYVQFLLSKEISSNGLRNILAVTFSNNAAKEMKERILFWLKGLYLNEPDKMKELEEIMSLEREEIVEKSGKIINSILNNYSDFQVRTLDSFMTTVFKSLAIDFGYNPDFDILLNNDKLMEYAFNRFLRRVKIDSGEGELLKNIIGLVMENKSKSSSYSWEPAKAILNEVKNIYRKLSSTGKNINIIDYSQDIKNIKNSIKKQIKRIEQLINNSNLERSRSSSYNSITESVKKGEFPNLIGKGFKNAPVKKPLKKDLSGQNNFDFIHQEWNKLEDMIKVYTNYFARSYYNPYLKFFSAFKETLERVKKQEGKVFIEDINKMLSDYIDSHIVPDVYFRIGERVCHYLIDEFQDTSPVQWVNLYPLLDNSLSEGGSLLVVGDTKQSIYGFRDADYRIMKKFEEESPFLSTGLSVKELDCNYRSRKKILDFCERIFKENIPVQYLEAAEKSGLNNYTQKAMDESENDGYVEVSIYEKSDDIFEREKIQTLIHELKQRGYRYRDIAILTPRNEDVIQISTWLNEANIPFVSHSSLDIRKRKITGEIISLLNFLNSPPDDLAFASFCLGEIFSRALKKYGKDNFDSDRLHSFFFNNRDNSPLYKSFQSKYSEIWERFFEGLFKASGYLPLYDLVNAIFSTFMVFDIFKEEATLIKILEVIRNFEGKGSNNLRDFLDYSEERGEEGEWNIDVPEDVNAVKVMTVHKSKGLGFPVVINLLYGERLDKRTGYIIEEKDNNAALLKITQNIVKTNSDFSSLYKDNKIRERVNRLNSLYVGFTRARFELYVIGVKGTKVQFPFDILPVDEFRPSSKPVFVSQKPEKPENRLFTYHHNRQTGYSANIGAMIHNEEKKRGEFIHRVLSNIEYLLNKNEQEIEKEINRIIKRVGSEREESCLIDEIKDGVLRFLLNEKVKTYFQKKLGRTIKQEQEFTNNRGRLLRMDRVIIDNDVVTVMDFKTGREEGQDNHKEQLNKYMGTLKEIYPGKTIKGVIAYVDLLKVEELQL